MHTLNQAEARNILASFLGRPRGKLPEQVGYDASHVRGAGAETA